MIMMIIIMMIIIMMMMMMIIIVKYITVTTVHNRVLFRTIQHTQASPREGSAQYTSGGELCRF